MNNQAPSMLKRDLQELRDTIVSLITKQPDIFLQETCRGCEKKLGIKPIELNASFIRVIAENRNIKWSGK